MTVVRFFDNPLDFTNKLPSAEIRVEIGTTILEAARAAGIMIESPCNCAGTCGKCKVKVALDSLPRIRNSDDAPLLSQDELDQGFLLSCQTEVLGDLDVELIHRQDHTDLQILSHGHTLDISLDSYITKQYDATTHETLVFAGDTLIAHEVGDTTATLYGLVIDIGTTTLVLSLLDLTTGSELTTVSALNPQSRYAQDVLSRIKFASDEDGLATMYTELIASINSLLQEAANKAGIQTSHIYDVVFSGNTCMLHLATQVDPTSLGKFPYTPLLYGGTSSPAVQHQLQVAPCAQLYLPPIISAYVGADITSGILAANLQELTGITLFVDIGTNGEMALAVDGQLAATSTAAGPAFEGMNIACGMRAAPGAIEKFKINPNGTLTTTTIGHTPAIGMCGSGLLDIVGELVEHQVIGKNGKFITPDPATYLTSLLTSQDGKLIFQIENNIYLSQKDVRQVQLAKAAVRAGIESLLAAKQVLATDVHRVFIAGSFGYHLNADSLINIGLLPEEFRDKISFLGNTSKTGGQAFLVNKHTRQQMDELVKTVEVLELSTLKNFDKLFVNCLNF